MNFLSLNLKEKIFECVWEKDRNRKGSETEMCVLEREGGEGGEGGRGGRERVKKRKSLCIFLKER